VEDWSDGMVALLSDASIRYKKESETGLPDPSIRLNCKIARIELE